MAKQIKKSDIAEDDIFGNVRKSAEDTLKVMDKLSETITKTAKDLSESIKNSSFGDLKSINEFIKLTKDANKLKQDQIKLDKERAALDKELQRIDTERQKTRKAGIQANREEIKNAQELEKVKQQELKTEREAMRNAQQVAKEKERIAKAQEKAKKTAQDEANAYKQLEKQTRQLKNESKRLAAELLALEKAGKGNSKEFRELSKEYKRVTKAAQEGDRALKKIDSTVGDNFRNVGNYVGAVSKLKNVLGQLGIAFGGVQLIKGAGETIAEFDASIQSLVSITGASGEDLEFFKQQAIDLGTQVQGGASAVIEAYKLIGSAKPELLSNAEALDQVTQAAITLSQASGLELPDAATRLTDAMNQFGASSEEASTFIDTLSNGALFGAAAIPDVTDALVKFGAAARSSNVSVAESTALIEQLAARGIKGAEAGTALRNVLLKVSAPDTLPKEAVKTMNELGISFDTLKDTSIPFSERLQALKPLLKVNGGLTKVFGIQNVIAAQNLIEMSDATEDLTEKMETVGTAQDQAATNTDTLSFTINRLKEEWNAVVLGFAEGGGITDILKNAIGFLADNLQTIVSVVGKVVKAWILYRTWLIAVEVKQKLLAVNIKSLGGGLLAMGKNVLTAGKNLLKMNKGVGAASTGVKGFSRAIKSIPFVAIIGLVLELASAFYDVFTNADAAREAQERFADSAEERAARREKEQADREERAASRQKRISDEFEAIERKRREQVADRQKTQAEADAEALKSKKNVLQALKEEVRAEVEQNRTRFQTIKQQYDFVRSTDFAKLSIDKQKDALKQYGFENVLTTTAMQEMDAEMKTLQSETNKLGEEFQGLNVQQANITLDQKEMNKELGDKSKSRSREIRTEFSAQIDLLKELNELNQERLEIERDLNDVQRESDLENLDNMIKDELKFIQKRSELGENFELTRFEQLQERKRRLQQESIKEEADFEIQAVENTLKETFKARQKSIEAERDRLIKNAKGNQTKIAEINANFDAEMVKLNKLKEEATKVSEEQIAFIKEKAQKESAKVEEDIARETAERTAEIRTAAIENSFNRQLNETRLQLLKSGKKAEEIQKELDAREIELLEEKIAKKQALGLDTLEDEIALAEKRLQIEQKNAADLIAREKKLAEDRIAVVNALTDAFIEASNKRIAKIEEEIEKAEEQKDFLEKAAAEGNITAKESLAEQNRIIAEANAQKEREQRRQERIKFAAAVYEAYERNASDPNVSNPVQKTILDATLLRQFLATVPVFYEGTEDTGGGGALDSKGGFSAILHPHERVMTAKQNALVGDLSNDELSKIAMEYNTGRLIHKGDAASQIGGAWMSESVVKRLESIESTIRNKPEHKLEVEQVIDGAMTITRTTKKGNSVVFNRYRVKA